MIAALLAIAFLRMAVPARADDGHLLRQDDAGQLDQQSISELCLPAPEPILPPTGEIYHFMPVADAGIQEGNADTALGIGELLTVGYDVTEPDPESRHAAPRFARILLRHGVSDQLPRGTTIHRATLRMLGANYCAYTEDDITTLTARAVGAAWSEMDVTWTNQPPLGELYGSVGVPLWGESELPRYDIEVTDLVAKWVAGEAPEHGIAVTGPADPGPYDCHSRVFYSKGFPGFRCAPLLEVDYSLPKPGLLVPTRELVFRHRCGGAPLPNEQSLEIRSSELAPRRWRAEVAGSAPWVKLQNASGIVAHVLPDKLRVSLSAPPDCVATNTATISLTAEGLSGPAVTVRITSAPGLESVFLPIAARQGAGSGGERFDPANPPHVASQVLPWQDAPSAREPVRFAMVVGVSDYLHEEAQLSLLMTRAGAPGDGDINGSVSDAVSASESLVDPTVQELFALIDRNATRAMVYAVFERLLSEIERLSLPATMAQASAPETELIVFFSGHAGQVTDLQPVDESSSGRDGLDEYFAFFDFPLTIEAGGNREGFLLDDELSELLRSSGVTRYAALMDTCHAGGFERTGTSGALLAASREPQASIDYVPFEHGLFSYHVLQAARSPELDTNGDGWLSVREIQPFVTDEVSDSVAELNEALIREGHNPDAAQDVYADIGADVRLFRVSAAPAVR